MTWLLSILGIGGIAAALVFIPGALPALINGLSALLEMIRRHPWQCALIASLAACGWLYRGKQHAISDRKAALAELARVIDAGKQAERAQLAMNEAHRTNSRTAAGETQHGYVETGARAERATDSFIRDNRVRACPSAPGTGDPAAQGDPAAVPEGAAADTIVVAVRQPDVRACTADWNYAMAAHLLAVKQVALGVAEWGTTDPPAH